MTTLLAIFGVGGQGRECLDIAEAMIEAGAALEVVGFYDDAPSAENVRRLADRGYKVLGNAAELLKRRDVTVCLGVGESEIRARLDQRLVALGIECPTLVHPDSTIGSQVALGPGAVIFAGARLTTNIRVGRHVHVNQNATVGHDCCLEDYVTLNPQAAISGTVHISQRATVGAGAVVLQGLRVGTSAIVGASACVVKDVADRVIVKGVPAR